LNISAFTKGEAKVYLIIPDCLSVAYFTFRGEESFKEVSYYGY
jgi:hypothetical protein